jgi:hypothetical protein
MQLCLAVLISFLFATASFAKSDWIDDPSDKRAMPVQEQMENQPGEDDNKTPEKQEEASESPHQHGPLKAEVSRWGNNAAQPPMAGGIAAPYAGNPLTPERAPFLPPPHQAKVSSGTFHDWLNSTHQDLSGNIAKAGKTAIVELKGQWDDAGHALRNFGLPYTRISADGLSKFPLDQTRIIVVDCGCNLTSESQRIIRGFVADGGYLLTTDWALDSCLTQCFPGYVEWNGGYTDAAVVDAHIVSNSDIAAGAVSPAYWKIEKRSQFVRRMNPGVQVLARSRMLSREDPDQQGILAISFQYGKGRVLHLVGHFDTNSDGSFNNVLLDPSPGITVSLRQALAANFVANAIAAP